MLGNRPFEKRALYVDFVEFFFLSLIFSFKEDLLEEKKNEMIGWQVNRLEKKEWMKKASIENGIQHTRDIAKNEVVARNMRCESDFSLYVSLSVRRFSLSNTLGWFGRSLFQFERPSRVSVPIVS